MKFEGRDLPDWQQQVWDAKENIYQATKGKSFQEYLANIRKGAEAFRSGEDIQHAAPDEGK